MELAARKIMVIELAKYQLFASGVDDPTPEQIYHKLASLQRNWVEFKGASPTREQMLEAVRAAIHDQLHLLENA